MSPREPFGAALVLSLQYESAARGLFFLYTLLIC
nr:MAG TPA: hypothetical protein [Caudoviricetes sp.]